MLGSRGPSGSPSFPLALSEEDVRRLCGAAAFKRGEALQRAGHVHRTTVVEDTLSADVLGSWRRYDRVTAKAVKVSGSSRPPLLEVRCTCRGGSRCRHAAALLLQWVREPASFVVPRAPAAPIPSMQEDEEDEVIEPGQGGTPLRELARLLEAHTAVRLREIARQRRVRPVARNKAELVEQLTSLLAEPENIDATLTELAEDQRLTLDAAALLSGTGRATPEAIGVAYRALGGRGNPKTAVSEALEGLANRCLAVPQERSSYPPLTYIVPRVVAARLPAREDLLPVLDESRPTGEATSSGPKLGMTEILQVIAHELQGGAIDITLLAASPLESRTIPEGWRIHPDDAPTSQKAAVSYGQRDVRLLPLPPLLPASDLGRVAEQTGQPAEMIDFALRLALALRLMEGEETETRGTSRLVAREDRLRSFLALPAGARLAHMVSAWFGMADSFELGALVGEDGPLRLYYRVSYYSWTRPHPQGAAVRHLVARLIGRLQHGASDRWYDFSSLLDLLWHLAPSLLSGGEREITWWLTDSGQSNRPLKLGSRDDWRRVWDPLVGIILTGPMSWLGLVDVTLDRDGRRPQGFRLRAGAAALAGKEEAGELDSPEERPPLLVQPAPDGAPIIVVPAGSLDEQLHSLLVDVCDLVDASPRGLHYRLAVERVQSAFDDGLTGPELIGFLEDRAGGTLPREVRETLQGWWAGYGRIRLYDDLTLLDLGDDILLRELQATTSLGDAMVDAFTPRLVAVDGARVETLIAELRSLGHTPRVVEEP